MTGTVADMLVAVARKHGDREAIVDGSVRLGYAALVRRAAAAAKGLGDLGVVPGDRVAILLPNSWEHVVAYLGVHFAGAVAVLVNTRFTVPEIEHVLADSGSRIVLTDAASAPWVTGGTVGHLHKPRGSQPHLRGTGRNPATDTHQTGPCHPTRPQELNPGRRDSAVAGDRTLVAAPLFHATAVVSQLVGFLGVGGCCVLMPAFRADAALGLLADEQITVFAGVAAMLRLMFTVDGADLSTLRLFVMGGAPVPESFPAEVAARMPDLVLGNAWGLTEATSIVTYITADDYRARPWSVGRAVPGVELGISLDGAPPKDLREQVGELCVRGPVVTAGYWANPEATAATYIDGWLHTGDVGSIDADGYVRVLDRMKDMIIRGGENIYSLEVETAIATHPDVAEVAVVGVPDPIFDERVRAVVVPRPGSAPTIGSVQEHAAALLADYKVPVEVHFAAELPRNPSGKVLKRRLAEERDDAAR